ncbi:MAG: hypothetical protein ISS87_01110 [Candidatus Pacebacteria bacterium]|nr:hypothetical protein [Candidatus Paceibacterota bacterium]
MSNSKKEITWIGVILSILIDSPAGGAILGILLGLVFWIFTGNANIMMWGEKVLIPAFLGAVGIIIHFFLLWFTIGKLR